MIAEIYKIADAGIHWIALNCEESELSSIMENSNGIVVSAAVMAHPARSDSAAELLHALAPFGARIAYDPRPDDPPNALRTARRAWRMAEPGATHHLVVQDDVRLPSEFVPTLERAIALQPDRVFNIFNDWTTPSGQAIRMALLAGCSWAPVSDESVVAVGVVMPTAMIGDFLDYLDQHYDDRDSVAIYEFLRRQGSVALATAPCLVQHDEPMQPSLWHRNLDQGPRRAACFDPNVTADTMANGQVLRCDTVPFIPFETLQAGVATYPRRPGPAVVTDGLLSLPLIGETRASLSERFHDEMSNPTKDLQELVSPAHLFHVWMTSILTGFELNRSYGRTPRTRGVLVEQALRTLLVGGLKRTFSLRRLDELREVPVGWIADGVLLGASIAAQAGSDADAQVRQPIR